MVGKREKDEIEAAVYTAVSFSRELVKDKYPDFYKQDLVIKLDWSKRRVTHRGGLYANGPGMNLAADCFVTAKYCYAPGGYAFWHEYPSFNRDPIIGGAYIDHWSQSIMLVVGHEMAHSVQRFEEHTKKLTRSLPHGDRFKSVYTTIRLGMNKKLPDQLLAKREYQYLLERAKKRELYVN
jgi:hypothetical protein